MHEGLRGNNIYYHWNKLGERSMEVDVLKGKTLLVVDDEVDLRDIMASELEFMGAKVLQAGNITAAKESLKAGPIDLIISDIRMPGGTGIDLLDFVKAKNPANPPVILITGFADIAPEDAYNKGAEALLNKPFRLDDLIKVVERHTSPFIERFNDLECKSSHEIEVNFEYTLDEAIAAKEFLIGRGGVAFALNTQRKKIESSDCVTFNFHFKDWQFKGMGLCRWVKVLDGQKASMGVEFCKIEEGTLKFFSEQRQFPSTTAYIPTL